MKLELLAESYAICTTCHPPVLGPGPLAAVLRDAAGFTWVGLEAAAPLGATCRGGWRALAVEGPLDFELTGVLATLTVPLAQAGVPVFALSTWSTDFLLLPGARLAAARVALTSVGHELSGPQDAG